MRQPGASDRAIVVVGQIAFSGKPRSYRFESINKFVNDINL
jgi:hypothetical protein